MSCIRVYPYIRVIRGSVIELEVEGKRCVGMEIAPAKRPLIVIDASAAPLELVPGTAHGSSLFDLGQGHFSITNGHQQLWFDSIPA